MGKVELRTGHYYHIYNRGVAQNPIFFDEENWGFFIRRIRHYFLPELVQVIAYCLMPNHYHLLVKLLSDNFSSEVMQPFGTSYVKAINKQQGRVGPLFQGKFKAELVDRDEYLTYLSKYIHLNPVAAGLVAKPDKWQFSSYQDYIGHRNGTLPQSQIVLEQFPNRQAYRAYVEEEPTPNEAQYVRRLDKYIKHD